MLIMNKDVIILTSNMMRLRYGGIVDVRNHTFLTLGKSGLGGYPNTPATLERDALWIDKENYYG